MNEYGNKASMSTTNLTKAGNKNLCLNQFLKHNIAKVVETNYFSNSNAKYINS
jgi:hypothetical protein